MKAFPAVNGVRKQVHGMSDNEANRKAAGAAHGIDTMLDKRSEPPFYGMSEPLDNLLNVLLSPKRPQKLINAYLAFVSQGDQATLAPFDRKVRSFIERQRTQTSFGIDASAAFLPLALTHALADLAPHGWLYAGVVNKTAMGAPTRALLGTLIGAGYQEPPAGSRHKLHFLDAKVRTALLASRVHHDQHPLMPALQAVAKSVGGSRPLQGMSVALCQHMYPTNGAMLDVLTKLGCDPRNTHFPTKRTSVNEETLDLMVSRGWMVTQPLTGRETDQAAGLLRDLMRRQPEQRILIIDEGAKFITAIHSCPDLLANKHRFVCVEQTESGIATLEAMGNSKKNLEVPVWNVARSYLKKHWEAGFIGEHVVSCAMNALASTGASFSLRSATVLGYGAVGKHVAEALRRRNIDVGVFDIDDASNREAERDGFRIGERAALFAEGPVVFGCANSIRGGVPALTRDQMEELLPSGAVLVNAGSGNDQWGLPSYAASAPQVDEELQVCSGTRQASWNGRTITLGRAFDRQPHRVVRMKDRNILVLDSGFVVNRTEGVPAPYIDLTRALMTVASIVASTSDDSAPGLHEIRFAAQSKILEDVNQHLSSLGHSLLAPQLLKLPQPAMRLSAPTVADLATWEDRLKSGQERWENAPLPIVHSANGD